MNIIINKKIKDVFVEDESIILFFEDDTKIKYATEHDQDCCEHVYGDFSVFEHYKKSILEDLIAIEEIQLVKVNGDGFLLRFLGVYDNSVKVFVPCYDFQNGCYSSDLSLTITQDDVKTNIDISDLVSHHYR